MLNEYYHQRYADDQKRVRRPKTVGRGGFRPTAAYGGPQMLGEPSMKIRRTSGQGGFRTKGKGGYSDAELNDMATKLGYKNYDELADAALDGGYTFDKESNVATRKDTGQSYDFDDYKYEKPKTNVSSGPTQPKVSKPTTVNNNRSSNRSSSSSSSSSSSGSDFSKKYVDLYKPDGSLSHVHKDYVGEYLNNGYTRTPSSSGSSSGSSSSSGSRSSSGSSGSSSSSGSPNFYERNGYYNVADLNKDGEVTKREGQDYFDRTMSQLGLSQAEYDQFVDDLLDGKTTKYEFFDQPRFSEEQRKIAYGDQYYPRVQQGTPEDQPYYADTWEQQFNELEQRYNDLLNGNGWMDQFYNQQQNQWAQQQQAWQQQQNQYQNQFTQMNSSLQDMQNKYAQMMENMGYYQMLQNYNNMYGMRNPRAQKYSPFL